MFTQDNQDTQDTPQNNVQDVQDTQMTLDEILNRPKLPSLPGCQLPMRSWLLDRLTGFVSDWMDYHWHHPRTAAATRVKHRTLVSVYPAILLLIRCRIIHSIIEQAWLLGRIQNSPALRLPIN